MTSRTCRHRTTRTRARRSGSTALRSMTARPVGLLRCGDANPGYSRYPGLGRAAPLGVSAGLMRLWVMESQGRQQSKLPKTDITCVSFLTLTCSNLLS
jgi:hypothetical protein